MVRATRSLILGVTHLGHAERDVPQEALHGIIGRICGWQPDAIAIENLPGEVIHLYDRLGGGFADIKVGGLPQALACADAVKGMHTWDLWEARRVGLDRNRALGERVVAWCAAYEPYTAMLLARRATDLPSAVRDALDDVAARGDECSRVAVEAAALLRLDRLHPFDDHRYWSPAGDIPEAVYEALIGAVYPIARQHPLLAGQDAALHAALEEGDLWQLWRQLNSAGAVADSDELESGYFLAHGRPEYAARAALADWRTRNLLMAGRLRAVTGGYPGGRVLALVGQAHKGPLEAALATDQWDLELAQVTDLDLAERDR